MPLEVGQVAAGVLAQVALVRLLARVHAVVALEVVEVRRGVVALRALVGLLAAVRLHVPRQVVGVVREEGARCTRVNPLAGTAAGSLARATARVLRKELQGAAGADLRRGAVLVIQGDAAQAAGEGEEQRGQGGRRLGLERGNGWGWRRGRRGVEIEGALVVLLLVLLWFHSRAVKSLQETSVTSTSHG